MYVTSSQIFYYQIRRRTTHTISVWEAYIFCLRSWCVE